MKIAGELASLAEMELKMKKLFYGFSFLFDDAGIRRFITILRTEPQLGFALHVLLKSEEKQIMIVICNNVKSFQHYSNLPL